MANFMYQLGVAAVALTSIALYPNCVPAVGTALQARVTGGGHVDLPGGGKANFGFNGSSCEDPQNPSGQFNFHDMGEGVKMQGGVIAAAQCDPGGADCQDSGETCPAGAYFIGVGYVSKNPKSPGTGEAGVCLRARGDEQASGPKGEIVKLSVSTGPFAGYTLENLPVQGSINAHPCN
jgi:hypothetical protein